MGRVWYIYLHEGLIFIMVNVGKYTIHGSYGWWDKLPTSTCVPKVIFFLQILPRSITMNKHQFGKDFWNFFQPPNSRKSRITLVFQNLSNTRWVCVWNPPKGLLRRYLWVRTPTQRVFGRLGLSHLRWRCGRLLFVFCRCVLLEASSPAISHREGIMFPTYPRP